MELQDYLTILRKRWVSIMLVTALALAGAAVATLATTPIYRSHSQVFVSVRASGTTADLLQGSSFTQKQVKSYTDLVTSPLVLVPVIEHLDLATTPDELARSVSADTPLDSVLINITVTHEDPETASDIANSTANSLADAVVALEKPDDGPSPVQISTVRTATVPQEPSAPNTKLNVALGILVGLAAGFGVAVTREVLDTRIRNEAHLRLVTASSVIATIAHDDTAAKHPLIVQSDPHSARSEAFRRLRTNLQFLDVTDNLRAIVITSSLPGEGKSTTAINLAITLAEAGSRVVLVDADLRRPSVAEYMGVEGSVGLTTVLIGRATAEDVVQPWGDGYLHVLASGQVPPNPSELLGSRSMATLLDELAHRYDVVLIDAPPLLPVTDGAILARLTGGAVVVVGAHVVHRQQLADSLGALETVGARVLGIVLNRVPAKEAGGYTYYDYSPTSGAPQGRVGRMRKAREGRTRTPVPRRGQVGGPAPAQAQRAASRRMSPSEDAGMTSGPVDDGSRTPRPWPGELVGRDED